MAIFSKALSKVYSGAKGVARRGGFAGEVMATAEQAAASAAFGYIHGKYREHAEFKGVPLNAIVGVAGTALNLGALFLSKSGNVSPLISHAGVLGAAGLNTFLFAEGVSRGTADAGRKVFLLESGVPLPAIPAGMRETVMGAIPQAVGGMSLDMREVRDLSRSR